MNVTIKQTQGVIHQNNADPFINKGLHMMKSSSQKPSEVLNKSILGKVQLWHTNGCFLL